MGIYPPEHIIKYKFTIITFFRIFCTYQDLIADLSIFRDTVSHILYIYTLYPRNN